MAERQRAADLVTTAFSASASPPTPDDRAALARAIAEGYADRTSATAITAWSGESLLGAVLYAATGAESAGFPSNWAVLRALGVTMDAVGRGIGTALTAHAIERAMTEGLGGIGLYTADNNLRARRLYAALGFVIMSPPFIRYGLDYHRYGLDRLAAMRLLTNLRGDGHADAAY